MQGWKDNHTVLFLEMMYQLSADVLFYLSGVLREVFRVGVEVLATCASP